MSLILTIGIPTYNRADYIQKALDSILSQMQSNVEILISDNGSTDGTKEVIQKYQNNHSFVRFCGFEQNQGIDKNITNVLANAKGKYIHLFSDDDLYTENLLKQILEEIAKTAPSVICLNHFSFTDDGKIKPPFLPSKRKAFSDGGKFFKYCGLGFLSSLVIKKKQVDRYLHTIKNGKECAHLDVVARIAIKEQGPFIYLGKAVVAGRAPSMPRYDMIRSCIIYQKQLLTSLYKEGLQKRIYLYLVNKLVYKDLVRIVYKLKVAGNFDKASVVGLLKEFQESKIWYWSIKKILRLNTHAVRILFKVYQGFLKRCLFFV